MTRVGSEDGKALGKLLASNDGPELSFRDGIEEGKLLGKLLASADGKELGVIEDEDEGFDVLLTEGSLLWFFDG